MSDREFLQSQIVETERLLELAGQHPLMGPQLSQRLTELQEQLRNAAGVITAPRATLYFAGGPVNGTTGIDAEFAGGILDRFSKMVKAQFTAMRHGMASALGQMREDYQSKLLLTALPRGSFGLELSQPNASAESAALLSQVLVNVTDVINAAGQSDDEFNKAIEEVPPRVLPALRDMVKLMNEKQADFRIVTADREIRLTRDAMPQVYERVAKTVYESHNVDVPGTFRGLTLDSWRFDFRASNGDLISGRIAEEVSEHDATGMQRWTNQECIAVITENTFVARDGRVSKRYELLAIKRMADQGDVFGSETYLSDRP